MWYIFPVQNKTQEGPRNSHLCSTLGNMTLSASFIYQYINFLILKLV